MKIYSLLFLALTIFLSEISASPKINFKDLIIIAEQNSHLREEVYFLSIEKLLPLTILTNEGVIIEAKGIESGELVYAVIIDKGDVYNNGSTAFYYEINKRYDLAHSKLIYANSQNLDNSDGRYNSVITDRSGSNEFLMVTDWTFDRVYLFSKLNGDLLDTAFIPSSPGILASPKMAMQHFNGKSILVSDQITDGVYIFDTSGAYMGLFAPNGGLNYSILDNIRGIRYRSNNNLIVCVASGASQNTIQQFDTSGVHMGTFVSNENLNSPFDILFRNSDILITNSSGSNRITRYDLNGNFLSYFYSGTDFSFPQQIQKSGNGNLIVAAFSSPSGIAVLDSNGNFIKLLTGVTSVRSVFLLDNGNYLVTNGAGVHEVDTVNANIIRTISTSPNFQYITVYTPYLQLLKLRLKVFPEGFYFQLFNQLSRNDTITVYLRNALSPYALVDSSKEIIDSLSLSGLFTFNNAPTGTYYITVKHLNSIETWSKSGGEYLATDGIFYNYDFTVSNTQAYGNNLRLRGSKYCLYSGDVNQDGYITLFDVIPIYNDAVNFVTGRFIKTDLTGDNIVDLTDVTIGYNNSASFISKITP